MSDLCLVQLAKEDKRLDKKAKLDNLLRLWLDLDEFANKIFAYI